LTKKNNNLRSRASAVKNGHSRAEEARGDGGPDEAAAFIAETVADLARLAERHQLEMLVRLLRMSQLEAEEHVRLRSKLRLS
jgi:hypothetical protein